jgi:hypothetical protein
MATTDSAKVVVLNVILEEYNFAHGFLRRVIFRSLISEMAFSYEFAFLVSVSATQDRIPL